jgi:heptosyltransferase-2
MPAPITDAGKILIRTPNWVGDAILALPALEAVRAHFPRAELAVLARPGVADVYSRRADVQRILVFDHRGKHQGIAGLLRLAGELSRESYDLAVLFQKAVQAALLTSLAGIQRRVGYARDARGPLLTRDSTSKAQRDSTARNFLLPELVRRASGSRRCRW